MEALFGSLVVWGVGLLESKLNSALASALKALAGWAPGIVSGILSHPEVMATIAKWEAAGVQKLEDVVTHFGEEAWAEFQKLVHGFMESHPVVGTVAQGKLETATQGQALRLANADEVNALLTLQRLGVLRQVLGLK